MIGSSPLRVVLDARLTDGDPGGVQQTIIGLAHGLSSLEGDDEYLFLASPASTWLSPHLRGRCRLLSSPESPAGRSGWLRALARRTGTADALVRAIYEGPLGAIAPVGVADSDQTIEQAGADVMHFTTQSGFRTSVPSIYVPHDLQHAHHPQYFSPFVRRWRAANYGALARQAKLVVALSQWGKRDIVQNLGLPENRIATIGWAAVLQAYPEPRAEELVNARLRLHLPAQFLFYPAQTWPHKNHLKLLDAMAILRDRGLCVHAVCSGKRNSFFPVLERQVRALGLAQHVSFLGFVPPVDIQSLYRLATLLVYPSRFEGFGLPVWEAFQARLPVACSSATALPEVADDAALFFDPEDASAMADSITRLWSDRSLRAELISRASNLVSRRSWGDVALRYRALYRLVARSRLDERDNTLLQEMFAPAGYDGAA